MVLTLSAGGTASSAPSSTISRKPGSTVGLAADPGAAKWSGFGPATQARAEAASAATADGKNETLADRAGRTGQTGRQ
jgi:hypothetical protein